VSNSSSPQLCSNTLKITFLMPPRVAKISLLFMFYNEYKRKPRIHTRIQKNVKSKRLSSKIRVKLRVTSTENFRKNKGFEYWSFTEAFPSDPYGPY